MRQDDAKLVDQLLSAGADVKAANRYGVTPLYLACQNGSAAMIEKLLKAGADANATVTEGETALMTASRTGNPGAVKVLLDHGAALDAKESWHGGNRADVGRGRGASRSRAPVDRARRYVNIRSTTNVWARQTTSEPREKWLPLGDLSPLMFAARQGCLECVKILVDSKAHINAVDPDGISVTLLAIINGHYDVAAYLVDKGAEVNLADRTGRTALYSAVDFHTPPQSNRPAPKELDSSVASLDLIKDLLAHGANVNASLKTQQPYRTKLDRGDDTMLTTGTTPLLRAAKAGDVDVVRLLLEKGADPKLATRAGINSLMAAAGLGTKEEDTTGRHKTEAEAIAGDRAVPESRRGRERGGHPGRHGSARRGPEGLRRGGPVPGRSRREAGREGQAGQHGAGRGDGQRGRRRRLRRQPQGRPRGTASLLRKLMAADAAKASAQ